jgi:hypothetical protein
MICGGQPSCAGLLGSAFLLSAMSGKIYWNGTGAAISAARVTHLMK